MENLSIINWELHQKIMSKDQKILTIYNTFNDKENILENDYLTRHKKPFSLQYINTVIGKDIIVLECHLQDREKYFIDSNTFLIHTESEPNDSNRVTDESTIYWIIKSFIEYLQKEEERINTHKETIKKIIKNNI
jgi:hypothetical protein